jgi:hypothetical protein
VSEERSRYRFGPLERRGLVAGWRGGQIACVASGLAVCVLVLRTWPDPAGLVGAVLAVCAALAAACWPVGGRTVEQWAPVLARSGRLVLGPRRAGSDAPCRGRVLGESGQRPQELDCGLEGVALLGPPGRPGSLRLGVLRDGPSGCWVAALGLRGHSFSLLSGPEQDRRVAAWAGVLAGLAREGAGLHRLQWLERSLPDDGEEAARYLAECAQLDPSCPAYRSYAELLGGAGPVTRRHQVLLALSVSPARLGVAGRRRGQEAEEAALEALEREARSLMARLARADVEVDGALSPRALARWLRQAVASSRELAGAGGERGWPWAVATEAQWSRYRTDAVWHATYWVSEWPRTEVGADFLAPLLLQAQARRTVAVVMEPVSPLRAVREVERARTADLADAELRRRGGYLATARRRREEEGLARREAELAEGHAQFRFSGYVTVSADSEEALEGSCSEVEQAAGESRLELRRLFGDQQRAFSFTLPLCRGLA